MQKRQLWARRIGRPLRVARSQSLGKILDNTRLSFDEDKLGQLDPQSFFDQYNQVVVEIGFGNGEHLISQAKGNPNAGFIGCEPFINGVSAMLVAMSDNELTNIRVWPDDARVLLRCLKPESCDKIFVLFPDPWPKARHHKRRYIQPETIELMTGVLRQGGVLRVATDHQNLAMSMKRHLSETNKLENITDLKHTFEPLEHDLDAIEAVLPDGWPSDWVFTRYQQKAKAGNTVWLGEYQRVA